MRVAALQIEHHFGDPDAALEQVDRLLASAAAVDLALLPEACLTGYVSPDGNFDLSGQAEPVDGPSAGRLADLARRHGVALAGPLIEREGDRCYNAFLVHGPDGSLLARYRKRHPWFPETWATAGEAPYPLLSVAGRRLVLAICYDVHFVESEARAMLRGADALLFPSAWVNGRQAVDTRAYLLPRLALRNRTVVVNANWARSRPRVPGQGGSMIVGADGTVLAAAPAEGPCLVEADV